MKLLWLAPALNHYKARFLNKLAQDEDISLTVISGNGRLGKGDRELKLDFAFEQQSLPVSKTHFGISKRVRALLQEKFNHYDWVLIPAEKKNIILFLFAIWLRQINSKTKLFSYNHARIKSKNYIFSKLDNLISNFFYNRLDRVIFYNEFSSKMAISQKLISHEKAFWANNTLDNTEINKHYEFCLPPKNTFSILFLGRLIPSKRLDLFFYYTEVLINKFPQIEIHIIGDGPENIFIDKYMKKLNLHWHGTLIEESEIAQVFKRVSLVFVPGDSGLSINHSFMYGRPYITLNSNSHGPEINYIDEGENGYILPNNKLALIDTFGNLINDRELLEIFCKSAFKKGQSLSVSNWVEQFKNSLTIEK